MYFGSKAQKHITYAIKELKQYIPNMKTNPDVTFWEQI